MGAYQETLGDLHNLFGDTHAVHIRYEADGSWSIEEIVEGDTVSEVLGYVQFDSAQMRRTVRRKLEQAVREGTLTVSESLRFRQFYERSLDGYTYLESKPRPEGNDHDTRARAAAGADHRAHRSDSL